MARRRSRAVRAALVAVLPFALLPAAGTGGRVAAQGVTARAASATISAQASRRELVTRGDSLYVARDAGGALAAYEAALALPLDATAAVLRRAAGAAVDVGEAARGGRQDSLFRLGASYAERAVAADSSDAEAWFQHARALGRTALGLGPRDRTQYAVAIHDAAERALAIDPRHAGASHVLGRWHAEIMRLNGITRMIARRMLGGKVLGEANWADALRLLERACTLQPDRTVHLLALGEAYRDAGRAADARRALSAALTAPLTDPNDELYRATARDALAALR